MKIVYLVSTNVFSGAENITILLAKHLGKKHQVFYASPDGPIETYLKEEKIEHISISKMSIKEIRRLYKEIRPDIFHAVDFRASTYCALAKVHFVAHLHNNPFWLRKISVNSMAMLFFSFQAQKVICVSNAILDEYVFSKVISHRTRIIENVIDQDQVLKKANEESGSCFPEFDIGFVGRLTEQKDPLRLVNIIDNINKVRNVSAFLIGDGLLRKEIENEIKKRKLENAIVLFGFQENPYMYMKKAKLIFMPSKWEGFGLVAVEGMLLGCPVLGTRVGGLQKVIGNNSKNICDSDDDFLRRALELLESQKEWKKCSQEVKKRALQFCNIEIYAKKFEKIYLESKEGVPC